jgi:hypothetical protein
MRDNGDIWLWILAILCFILPPIAEAIHQNEKRDFIARCLDVQHRTMDECLDMWKKLKD